MQITSKHYIDRLESTIIQIARAFAIEHQVKVDPDAKRMTREALQTTANKLLSTEERAGLKRLWDETIDILKSTKSNNDESARYARDVYEALKIARFDNV